MDYGYRAFRVVWIRAGLTDSTALNLTLASAVLAFDARKGIEATEFADNAESSQYYSESLRQLSRRLTDPVERVSPGVIAAVIGCLCHDVCQGSPQSSCDGISQRLSKLAK